jgi:hypothetical protein
MIEAAPGSYVKDKCHISKKESARTNHISTEPARTLNLTSFNN